MSLGEAEEPSIVGVQWLLWYIVCCGLGGGLLILRVLRLGATFLASIRNSRFGDSREAFEVKEEAEAIPVMYLDVQLRLLWPIL